MINASGMITPPQPARRVVVCAIHPLSGPLALENKATIESTPVKTVTPPMKFRRWSRVRVEREYCPLLEEDLEDLGG